MDLSASTVLLVLYFGCGVAMVLGMRLADSYGIGDDADAEDMYQHWLGWLVGYDTLQKHFSDEQDSSGAEDAETPWLVERLADLLLILFGPAMFVIVGLLVLARRLMGR